MTISKNLTFLADLAPGTQGCTLLLMTRLTLGGLSLSRRVMIILGVGIATPAFVSIQALINVRHALLDARASEVKHLDEAAWTLVASYYDRASKGLMTEDTAKEEAKAAVRRMRFDHSNYFFIWDLSGKGVAHGGNPSLEGKNFISGPDAAKSPGVADMVSKLVDVAGQRGEGYAAYQIPKAGQSVPLDKIGYSKLFEPWGWAIGTGAYVTDIDTVFWSEVRTDVGIACCLIVLAGFLSFILGRDLSRSLNRLTRVVQALAGGDLAISIPSVDRGDEVGVMARAMQVFRDDAIEAKKQDVAFQQITMRLESALSNILQGLCVYDSVGRLEIFNERYCRIFGISPEDLQLGLFMRDVIKITLIGKSDTEINAVVAAREAFIGRCEAGTMVIELATGGLVSITHATMPNGGWVATYEDVTDRHAADAKISHMARHDALTGLPNRLVLNEQIETALTDTARGGRSAVLCLDLDDFKRVNDTLGHPVGDSLLVAVAGRLLACVGPADTVARLGGDEFVIVQIDAARPEDVKLLAERIIAEVQQPFFVDGHQISIGISIGIALMPDDGSEQATVLKNADTALYRAKAEERGTFCFFEADMDARLQRRHQLELDLRAGLARAEFVLFYQPLVSLASKQVVGFEALLRWKHPERGMVPPGEFIAVAEEIGLIVPMGEWVIREACFEAASWASDLKVAVNLSAYQFKSKNLIPTVARSLQESNLDASRLELEITETVLLQDNESTIAMLHELRALGVRIAMDDFGTGYSSLSYLRSFPFDKIKIDQSFVRDLSHREDAIHVVRAIRGLCAGLGMTTTAEGVETEEQFEKISAEGCTEIQGFLFSAPRPACEIPIILERVKRRHWRDTCKWKLQDHELPSSALMAETLVCAPFADSISQ